MGRLVEYGIQENRNEIGGLYYSFPLYVYFCNKRCIPILKRVFYSLSCGVIISNEKVGMLQWYFWLANERTMKNRLDKLYRIVIEIEDKFPPLL
jgi:hypothetical protein